MNGETIFNRNNDEMFLGNRDLNFIIIRGPKHYVEEQVSRMRLKGWHTKFFGSVKNSDNFWAGMEKKTKEKKK